MKVPYKLAGGETALVKVNAGIAQTLADFAREDKNAARKYRRRKEVSIDAMKEETGWEPADLSVDIEADIIAKEEKEMLHSAIKELSEKQRELIWLRFYEEKTTRDIAAILGVSHQAVCKRLSAIIAALKNSLKNYLD